jgi:uncharacterized iron-regulated membrane protein
MSSIRMWHTYLGMILAPSIIFFALTGLVQIFSLHEAHGGYKPPALIEKLSAVHKDQVFEAKEHDAETAEPPEPADAKPQAPQHSMIGTYVLKWFFALVALGLGVSTVLGVWMGLKGTVRRRTNLCLLGLGIVLPIVLTLLS